MIAADPVGARYVLKATGPVTEPGGTKIDRGGRAAGAAARLVPASTTTPPTADGFYAGVAASIFRAVGAGQGDPARPAHRAGPGRHRGPHPHLVGEPRGAEDARRTPVGARVPHRELWRRHRGFLNDGTTGQARLLPQDQGDGRGPALHGRRTRPRPSASISTTSRRPTSPRCPPTSPARSMGASRPGTWPTNVTVYAPGGAPLQALGRDDGFVSGTTATVAGRDVQVVTSMLTPGAHETYRVDGPRAGRRGVPCGPLRPSPAPASSPQGADTRTNG